MKFVVTKDYGNEVEVKLHWETKDKIRKIVTNTLLIGGTFAATAWYVKKSDKKDNQIED